MFETPPKAANDNEGPDTRSLIHEQEGSLDLAKERALRSVLDEIARSGNTELLNDTTLAEARKLVSGFIPKNAIDGINVSKEENWRKMPALYVAYLDIVDEFRNDAVPEE